MRRLQVERNLRLSHLSRRFFEVAQAAPLSSDELSQVEEWLDPPLLDLFRSQQDVDQRHGFDAAGRILQQAPDRRDLLAGALLHDVAKRHANLGAVGRTLATVAGAVGTVPLRAWSVYLDHAALGAAELEAAGADQLTVSFTRHQDGPRPADIDAESWRLLRLGDQEKP